MPDASQPSSIRRFGPFEIILQSEDLRKSGMRVRLSGQSFRLLAVLVERPGELVTREELRSRLWPADTFVDFDHGLNNAVARIREVLDDSAEAPRYVETIPRLGYRFIAPLTDLLPAKLPPSTAELRVGSAHEITRPASGPSVLPTEKRFRSTHLMLLGGAAVLVLFTFAFALYRSSHVKGTSKPASKSLPALPVQNARATNTLE